MKILFVHQNFPGQFLHLAPELKKRGHQVVALTDAKNNRPSPISVVRYQSPDPPPPVAGLGQSYCDHAQRGWLAARACRALRDRHGFNPDVIFGHSGWGETLFLREIWPDAKLLVYAELMYQPRGQDVGFDPEISPHTLEARVKTLARSTHLIQALVQADAGLTPTQYQASTFPPELRPKLTVIHDGVDTRRVRPDPEAVLTLPNGRKLRAGDEVLTYVARSLEPYRGFHRFMRALPAVMAARPKAQIVVVGGDRPSYGAAPADGQSWRSKLLAELGNQIDHRRIHFLGRVAYRDYLSLLQVSRVHCYLTYPFVLSWSLIEAMAAECYIVASDTAPVREVIRNGENGHLVGFFDQVALQKRLILGLSEGGQSLPLRQAARREAVQFFDAAKTTVPRLITWIENYAPE